MAHPEVQVERVVEVNEQISAELGSLMPDLSDKYADEPIDPEWLNKIVESDREIIIARLHGRIVGCGVMNLIMNIPKESELKSWLESFVVEDSDETRGTGIGYALWQEFEDWSREQGAATMRFTSGNDREEAHAFYARQGAKIADTNPFIKEL